MVRSGFSRNRYPWMSRGSSRSMRTQTRSPPRGAKTVRRRRVRLKGGKVRSVVVIYMEIYAFARPDVRKNFRRDGKSRDNAGSEAAEPCPMRMRTGGRLKQWV